MNTTSNPTAIASRVLLALGATALLSSCSMPPRQAWSMIQHDGLFNYWAYASGHQPSFSRPSPPLQRSSQSLGYRPSHLPYGQPRVVGYAPASQTSALATNRYYAPSTAPAPASQIAPPAYRPKTSTTTPRRSTKPRAVVVNDEPVVKPNIVESTPKKSPAPSPSSKPSTPGTASSPAPKKELPYGSAVVGRANMVTSPYASKTQLVDVAGMSAGQTVKCPYSGKLFRVPPTQQATNKTESKLEAPESKSPPTTETKPKAPEAPKSEPKTESKPEEKKP